MPEPIVEPGSGAPGAGGAPEPRPDPKPDPLEAQRAELERERSARIKAEADSKKNFDELEKTRLAGLKEKEDWKRVAQEYEEKYNSEKKSRENLGSAIVTDKKMTAVREAAIKAGMLDTALEDLDSIDLPQVTIETTSTGRTNVLGVASAIQFLKTKKPHWFGNGTPNVNGGSPGVGSPSSDGRPSTKEFLDAEDKARKTGDWAPVKALQERYFSKR